MNSVATLPANDTSPLRATAIPESNEDLSNEITRLAGHIAAAEYRFIKLLAALIDRRAWTHYGIKSPAHWLNYYCGIGLNAAREKVRVAKALAELPLIDEAFSKGEISFSKVRAMTRSATPANEFMLLAVARHGTAQHVEMLVRKHQRVLRIADSMRDRERHQCREFRWRYDDDGMFIFSGRLSPEDGAAFLKAMDAMLKSMESRSGASKAERQGDVTAVTSSTDHPEAASTQENVTAVTSEIYDPPVTFAQKRADALLRMADQALARLKAGSSPAAASDRFQVIVHLNGGARCRDNVCTVEHDGHHLPLSHLAMRRLACDATLLPVVENGEGNVLNVGRRSRVVPPAMRRALQLRDQTCRFPGCCEARWVDAHHVVHWCEGGETRLDNLVLLCRRHHRLVHTEGYLIARNAVGRFEFHRPDGELLPHALTPQFPDTALGRLCEELAIERAHAGIGLEIDESTILPKWGGERLDYNYAICGMRDSDERAAARDVPA